MLLIWTAARLSQSGIAIVCLCLLALGVHAQPRQFRHYTASDGLPQSQVLVVHQDQLGFLWAGTYGGLGRFDGRTFLQYNTGEGLSSNAVQAIVSEKDGTLWAGQSHGLCALHPQRVRFECISINGIAESSVQALLVRPDGLWVGTSDGLYLLRRDAGGQFDADVTLAGDITSLAWATDGRVWAGGRQGLWQVDATGKATPVALPAAHIEVRTLLPDRDQLWIGTGAGLLLKQGNREAAVPAHLPMELQGLETRGLALDPEGSLLAATRLGLLREQAGTFVLLKRADGLSSEDLYAVFRDREGIVWVAGDGGLSSYVAGAFVGYTQAQGLLQNLVRAIDEDSDGRLWLGTRQGVQVVRVDPDGRLIEQFRITHGSGLANDRIFDIALPNSHEAFLATGEGLAHWREGQGVMRIYTVKDGLPSNATRALHLQTDGTLFIATLGGVAVMRNGRIASSPHPELVDLQIISITEDRKGRVWFGSLKKGLLVLDADGRIRSFNTTNGLSDETIWHSAPDANGGLWIATNGDGLFHRADNGVIRRYTTADGLIDNFVWQVLVDRTGDVWAYTNRGLARFDGADFSSYGVDDGLLHQEGVATAAFETARGQRWFASNEGLMQYVGSERKAATITPMVSIHQALAAGKPLAPGAVLAPGARNFEFNFSAPLLRRNSDLRYRYRLRGAGDEWVELRTVRPIAYANLGTGAYVFEADVRRAGQPWINDIVAFAFQIKPPLWQTPLFQLLLALVAAGSLWLAFRFRLRRIELGRRALEELVHERTEALERANQQLEYSSFTDPLTELRNRRYMASQVDIDVALVCRSYTRPSVFANRDMIFMMIDIDHFKQINDAHGHIAGDHVLREYAQIIRSVIRESDYAVRWGGEEFLLVARQTEAAQCGVLAERLLESVRSNAFVIDDAGTTIRSTCSVGVSHFPFVEGEPSALDWAHVIEVSDAAVYLAKAGGRDGWVAIHGITGQSIPDQSEFVRRLKAGPDAMASAGWIKLSGTRSPDFAT